MAIYKIKRFTRAEKQAFFEMYRKLHNNKYKLSSGNDVRKNIPVPLLPNTSHPRDVLRLNKLAIDWNNIVRGKGTKHVDFKSAKTLFQNAGMSKMANQVEKIGAKYSNVAAIDRLRRIKEANPRFVQKFKKANQNTQRHLIDLEEKGQVIGEKGSFLINDVKDYNPSEFGELKSLASYAKGIKPGKGKYSNRIPVNSVTLCRNKPVSTIGSKISKNINGRIVKYYDPEIALSGDANTSSLAHETGHHRTDISPFGLALMNAEQESNKPAPTYWGKDTLPVKTARNLIKVVNEKSANSYGQAALDGQTLRKIHGEKVPHVMPEFSDANQLNYMGYCGLDFSD